MQIKYDQKQFNCMYRYVQYFYETVDDNSVKAALKNLQYDLWEYCSWAMFEGQYYIILNLNEGDISALLYVYENILFYTVEAQRIQNVCPDVFGEILKKYRDGEGKKG